MARDAQKAGQLKDSGNVHFQKGDFVGAESLYSKASVPSAQEASSHAQGSATGFLNSPLTCWRTSIIADDTNPSLYTNRAMARIRLGFYDSAISDCQACLKISADSMKAHFVLSQCQLHIRDYEAALESALQAHRICTKTNDKSLAAVTNQVLQCKKSRWEDAERRRKREGSELEDEMVMLLEQERDQVIKSSAEEIEQKQVKEEYEKKVQLLREVFDDARGYRSAQQERKEPPDWAIDDISFNIMVDPVMTKTGKSYERASILEHLNRHPSDPLTREPLQKEELRPNLALRQACEEFIEANGWAVDY
ncbi:U-box domain-containing protein [Xylariaceae sp. FL0016]|nr:U-box domain-containing protein [Xylariaceae sp. FL0016]